MNLPAMSCKVQTSRAILFGNIGCKFQNLLLKNIKILLREYTLSPKSSWGLSHHIYITVPVAPNKNATL